MTKDIKKAISIVIPIYNETDNVDVLTEEIQKALSHEFEYEIIFVDDGSQDDTVLKLQKLAQTAPVRIVSHAKNYGQSAGLVSGANAAKYPWIVTLDGDGQNDPADIPHVWAHLEKHENTRCVVFGNRKKRQDTTIRRLSSRIGNGIRQALLKDNCPDTGCSLKLFPRDVFLALPHFNHCHRFLPALFQRAGFKILNFKVNHRPRLCGVSKYGVSNRLWTGIVDLLGVMWLIRRPCHPESKVLNSEK